MSERCYIATERQRRFLVAVLEYTSKWGYPPTIREVGKAMSIRAGCEYAVVCHRDALVRKGLLSVAPGLARTMRVTPNGLAVAMRREQRNG